jgi:hypothetical protein
MVSSLKNSLGDIVLNPAGGHVIDRACLPLRLAFKMAPEDLRLFFDSRCGRRGA